MSYERVREFIDAIGLSERLVVSDEICATVELAAQVIGCEPMQIAKSMTFMHQNQPILIVMAGDAKVDNQKYKATFNQKATMIAGNQLEDLVGHAPGGVCPFALKPGVEVYLDESLKRFEVVYTAGGSLSSTIKLTLDELTRYSSYKSWVDVGKNWE